jgi:peptide/nickel transport system substrate-binding protein
MATQPRAHEPAPAGRSTLGALGLTLLAAIALAIGGCGHEPEKPLVIAFGDSPVALDPYTSNRNVGWSVLASFYDPLVSLGPNLRPIPALATNWEHTSPTRWRFHLRSGVTFCTGEPLTANDVVASFERARTLPASAVTQYLVGVRSITAADPATVVIETDGYQADLLNRLSFIFVVRARDAGPGLITAPVGTGSYRFAGERKGGTILAEGWPGWRGRPACDRVLFEFAGTGEAAVGRLLAGEADICHLVPDAWLAEVARSPIARLEQQPRLAVQLLGINDRAAKGNTKRALADVRVRRALLLALDRASWVANLFRGNGAVASQYVHPAVFGYDPALQPVRYDPVEARRLLAEAGFPHGFDVELAYDPAAAAVVEAIASDLAKVGVRVRLRPGTLTAPLRFFGWACSTGDASDFFESLVRSGGPRQFGDAGVDALLDAAGREADPVKRLALLQQTQRRTLDLLPLLPLTIRWGFKGVSSRVDVVVRYDEREDVAAFRWRT